MKLTAKGRYAVAAILDIAVNSDSHPTTVKQIASRQGVSQLFLERLAGTLRAKGLLRSIRGPKGGYILAKALEAISIADIIRAVDEPIDLTRCHGKSNCHGGAMCITHHIWSALNQEIVNFLKGITLAQLVNNPDVQKIADRQKKQNPSSSETQNILSNLETIR